MPRCWCQCLVASGVFLGVGCAQETSSLGDQIRAVAKLAKAKVSVACALPGSALNCDLNPHAHPPMQSVFKLPLAIAILHRIEGGEWKLDQPVRYLPVDRIPKAYSPLQDRYPNANVDVPLRELLRMAVALSDNVAADILLRIAGGPKAVNDFIASLGIRGFHLVDGEDALHRDVEAQYRNWFEASGAVALLRLLNDHSPLSEEHTQLLLGWMTESVRGNRIKAGLPPGTIVAHKAGTSEAATNDIGLMTLPDGRQLALAVFITNGAADEATREHIIAEIAQAVYQASLR